jgi:hypothetical protein
VWGVVVLVLVVGSMKHSGDIVVFEYPSSNIMHSVEKKIFIDTLEIAMADTIKIKDDKICLFPFEAWLEKKRIGNHVQRISIRSGS